MVGVDDASRIIAGTVASSKQKCSLCSQAFCTATIKDDNSIYVALLAFVRLQFLDAIVRLLFAVGILLLNYLAQCGNDFLGRATRVARYKKVTAFDVEPFRDVSGVPTSLLDLQLDGCLAKTRDRYFFGRFYCSDGLIVARSQSPTMYFVLHIS
jgi:hypothetical protein